MLLAARRAPWGQPACCPLHKDDPACCPAGLTILSHLCRQGGQCVLVLKAVLLCQPKPTTTCLCMRRGNHGNVRASSMFLFQEAGQSPSRRLAQHQTPCLGSWKGIVPGQMDMPKLTAPVLGLLPQSCAPLPVMAICCLGCTLEPAHPGTVLWHGCHQAPSATLVMEWHQADQLAPACSEVLPAMRLCKHRGNEPGLTLCHCALLQPQAEPITPCSSPWDLKSKG